MKVILRILAVCLLLGSVIAQAQTPDASVRQLWQLIDYVGVDYGGAVQKGNVVSSSEYAEMQEFAERAMQQAKALPEATGKADLLAATQALHEAVGRKADAKNVGELARQASSRLLAAYPVPVAPQKVPELQRGQALYQTQCAGCHGSAGRGDGPLAAQLATKPIAFTDRDRAASRSLMALYQVISQGVAGTPMPAFGSLADEDRWALAWYAGTLSHDDAMRQRGAKLWQKDDRAKAAVANLNALTTQTEAGLTSALGADGARDLMAYLRSDPAALASTAGGGLSLARNRLQESLAAARAGKSADATRLGLSAYLDGFEPVEPTLAARNKPLMTQIESTMLSYRAALAAGKVSDAEAMASRLDGLFAQAETELRAGASDAATTFAGALTILLREGVEALLIVVGMIAFLRKADRTDLLPHVHAGWVAALAAGGVTWAVATYVVGISGASREVTEGLSSLFAAVVLLGVGLWMHQKSSAGRWQAYLKDKLSSAMSRRSAWALFGLSFIAVYREVFETVLFYSALAVDGHSGALLGGLACGVAILALIAWLLLRTSARMPIGKFFSASSLLVAVLAVVLAGKGVAGLQEAGWLSANPIPWPHVQVLGMYPSAETAIAQIVVLLIAVGGFSLNALQSRRAAAA
ncbi:cytochrome c/FTR1 family iron permease [Piscinibacter terrae]|uniref:Iron permease n=1 Tax=Piscinibacter terrae TaxID=2496871 RepID=A0A3N7HLE7_9BURK|nr:cytochrome c/FTR1 family iron permease [Albitalea terrae]RQP21856.1 iron permease [Albitalea terrae]